MYRESRSYIDEIRSVQSFSEINLLYYEEIFSTEFSSWTVYTELFLRHSVGTALPPRIVKTIVVTTLVAYYDDRERERESADSGEERC